MPNWGNQENRMFDSILPSALFHITIDLLKMLGQLFKVQRQEQDTPPKAQNQELRIFQEYVDSLTHDGQPIVPNIRDV